MAKEKSSSSKKKKDGDSSKKAGTSSKKTATTGSSIKKAATATSSSVKTKSGGSKKATNGSAIKSPKQALSTKPPQSKVAKTVNKKAADATKKATIKNKGNSSGKDKPKAKVATKPKPKPTEEEETESEPSEVVQVVQSKKEDKKAKKPKAKAPSKASKNKAKPPPVKPAEVEETEEEETSAEQEAVPVEASTAEPDETEQSQLAQVTTEQAGESSTQAETTGEEGEGEWAECEEGTEAEAVEEEKPKEEKLEFTKPTINQIKKDKKEKPLSLSEKITNRDFESLNDGVADLNSGVQMLKHSYGSIIKSLVAMQNRRSKKKTAKEAQEKVAADGKPINFLTTLSTADPNELKTKSCLEAADKYDIERFLNPITRDETFKALFEEVDELNQQTDKLRTSFFDARGHFLRDKYDAQTEVKLDRAQLNEFKLWTKKLANVVDDIARNYNDDLLNMFRLT